MRRNKLCQSGAGTGGGGRADKQPGRDGSGHEPLLFVRGGGHRVAATCLASSRARQGPAETLTVYDNVNGLY